jgi:hypothetical protein
MGSLGLMKSSYETLESSNVNLENVRVFILVKFYDGV